MKQMAENGFNSMHLWGGCLKRDKNKKQLPELDLDKLRACFDGAKAADLKVIISLGGLIQNNPESPFKKFDLTDDQFVAMIEQVVRFTRTRPELLSYEIVDEPEFFVAPEWTERVYKAIKALDPYHPSAINTCRGARSALTYASSADILGVDYYPGGYWPASTVGPLTSEVVHLTNYKPVKMWIQGYKIFKPRAPTPEELKMMTWSMLARGSSMLFYFIGRPKKELWDAQGLCAREIRALTPAVAAGRRETLKVSADGVYGSLRRAKGGWWVIAVNETGKPTDAIIDLSNKAFNGTVTVLFEGRQQKVAGGLIKDNFKAFERHVYYYEMSK